MAFNAGDLVATIRLEGVSRFNADARSAGDALSQTERVASRVSSGIRNAFGAAASGTAGLAAASATYVTTLFRTGAAYNTLQQTSRAALKTLLGSTEAVNAQMAQLDEFARNSPFSKATFLQAQQQLLGFGVEAKKVIPILGAVQDATAAVGGSNQQISEIVSILAKISSSGKITAEDLNQLGERGLDAASLLGAGFGKSAADIRKDISAGAIDAGRAIDVLTEQMTARFGGAAANVKQTWAGALDRIKAAQREIGATLAEPFISQQGGGMAITWGNQVADVLRAILTQTEPVVTIVGGRLAPAFAAITRGLDEARVVVKAWDSSRLETFLNRAGDFAPALSILGGALAGWTSTMARGIPVLGAFVGGLTPLTGALMGAALASPEVRAALADLLGALEPLVPVAGDLASIVAEGLNSALPIAADLISAVTSVARPFVDILGAVPSPVIAAVTAFVALRGTLRALDLQRTIDFFKRLGEQMAVQRALATMEGTTARLGGAFAVASTQVSGFGNSLKTAFLSNPIGIALTGVATAVSLVIAAMSAQAAQAAKTREAITAYRDTLTETGEQTEATAARIQASLEEAFDASVALKGVDPLEKFGFTMSTISDAVREGGPAYDALVSKLREITKETEQVSDGMGGMVTTKSATAIAAAQLITVLEEEADRLAAAEKAQKALYEEQQAALRAMSDVERSNSRINTALEILRDTASSAEEKLSALKQALDELNGGALTAAEAEQQLNDQVRSLADALAQTDENGNKLAATLVDSTGKIDTTTEAGSRLFDQVMGMRDAMLDAVIAADAQAKANGDAGISVDRARQIVEEYSGRLREQAEMAGLSEEQIQGLIATMDETPEVLAYAVTDDGTVDAEKLRLIELATQIRDTPDGEFTVESDDFPGLMEALRILGVDITTLPDGVVKVRKDDGSFMTVEEQANWLARARTMQINAQINTRYPPGWDRPVANGGLFNGGVKAFARGGDVVHPSLPPAVYTGGRPIYKFAEPETRWEAFISGKVGQEARNRQIAAEAVRRLGGVAQFGPKVVAAEFANGGLAGAQSAYDKALAHLRDRERNLRQWKQKRDRWSPRRHPANWNAANRHVKDNEKMVADAKQALEEAKDALASARQQVNDEGWDWTFGLRRGDQAKQGQTVRGGLSLVDEGRDIAKQLGGAASRSLNGVAASVERNLVDLEKKANAATKSVQAAEDRKTKLVETAEAKRASLLATTIASLETAVDKASDKLQSLRQASAQLASTVESTILGKLDLGALSKPTTTSLGKSTVRVDGATFTTDRLVNVPVSKGSILSGLRGQKKAADALAAKVKRLGQMGFPAGLIEEVLSLGLEHAEPMIDALLTMSKAEIADASSLYNGITSAAKSTGQSVADATFGKSIAAAEKSLAAVEKQLATANAKADALIAAAKAEGDRQIAAAKAQAASIEQQIARQSTRMIDAISAALSKAIGTNVKRATGGPIIGPGTGTSDSIPFWGSNGEWVQTAQRVRKVGGFAGMARLDQLIDDGTIPALLNGQLRGLRDGGPVVRVPVRVDPTTRGLAALADAMRENAQTGPADRRRGDLNIGTFIAGLMSPGEVFDEFDWRWRR